MYATRRMANENQQKIAKRYGFHQTGISKMEKGEIPVNPKILKDLATPKEIPDYIYLSIVRRRYRWKLRQAAKATNIATHRLGDMERGREAPSEVYLSWLHNVANA
jgi:transcriptional regulator with XRE-family HTH domain